MCIRDRDIKDELELINDLEDDLLARKEYLAYHQGWTKEHSGERSYYVKDGVLFTDINAVMANINERV